MAEKNESNSYRSILKATSIFGGVKIFDIIINLIRGKFVALFLGPVGIGISSIISNVATSISQFASCGLNLALVKEVALQKEDPFKLADTIAVAKRLFLFASITGAILCLIFAPFLSSFSFGSDRLTSQFIILSLAIYFLVDNGGRSSILQGMHEVKRLSKASLIGSLTGLVVGVPIYWSLGDMGIAPAIVCLTLAQNIFYRYQLHQVCKFLPSNCQSPSFNSPLVKKLFSLGIILLLSDMIGSVCNYLLLVIIRYIGNIDDVGFFQSANSVTNQLVGVVFTTLSLDYFPRLSALANDNEKMNSLVNRQSEIIALLILPLSLGLILLAPLIVKILLSDRFLVIIPLLRFMAIGIVFKAFAFPMGYISFAKNNRRVFFWVEGIVGNILFMSVPLFFFYFFGLMGFGYGMIIEQTLCFIMYFFVNNRLYSYQFSPTTIKIFIVTLLFSSAALFSTFIQTPLISYSILSAITIAGVCYSFKSIKMKLTSHSNDNTNQ